MVKAIYWWKIWLISFHKIPRGIYTDYKADGVELKITIIGKHWVSVPVRKQGQPSPVDSALWHVKNAVAHLLYNSFKKYVLLWLPRIDCPWCWKGRVESILCGEVIPHPCKTPSESVSLRDRKSSSALSAGIVTSLVPCIGWGFGEEKRGTKEKTSCPQLLRLV